MSNPYAWTTDAVAVDPGDHNTRHENGGADEVSVVGLSGLLADDQHVLDAEVTAVAVAQSLFDAHTVLYATTDNTPVALTVGEQSVVGRVTGGNIVALTGAQILTILSGQAGADFDWNAQDAINLDRLLLGTSSFVTIPTITKGLLIDQGTADDAVIVFKSTGDVAHGGTLIAETAVYGWMQKVEATSGGLMLTGMKDADGVAGYAMQLRGFLAMNADTTKSTSGIGIMTFNVAQTSGTGYANIVADGNCYAWLARIGGATSTLAILDEDGDLWLNGGLTLGSTVTLGGAVAGGGYAISNIGAISTTGLLTHTMVGVQELVERATSGGPWYYRIVSTKTNFTDNVIKSLITVTVPNEYLGALIRLDYLANDTGAASRWRSGSRFITVGRTNGSNTVSADFEATAEQTILTGGADTIAVTWTLSALTGASGATQTFDIQVTIDSGDNSTGNLHFIATLLSAYYSDTGTVKITMAEAA